MSRIHFIGGEKGGVGKSVVSRLLAQHYIDRAVPFIGFDTDASHGTFTRFYAEYAAPARTDHYESLDRIPGQALEDPQKCILVDLAAQTDQPLTDWIDSSGVIELLTEAGVRLTYWHVMDDGRDSFELLGKLFTRFGGRLHYIVVLNHGRGQKFDLYLESETHQRAKELGAEILELPKLHPAAMQKIDHHNTSFWAAVNNPQAHNLGLMDRQRVKMWLKRVFAEFERLEV
ncbi:MAG: mobilization protein [Opitutales bacterium]